jgi:DNA-binding protein H-NS
MKKVVRLNENDIEKLVKKIIKEDSASINTFKDLRDDYVKYKTYSEGKIKELINAVNILSKQNRELKNKSGGNSRPSDGESFFGSFFDTDRD